MLSFRNISIQKKLTLIIALTSLAAVAISGLSAGLYVNYLARTTLERQLITQAKQIGRGSTAALLAKDPKAIEELMGALAADPHLLAARIYDGNNRPFKDYERDGPATFDFPQLSEQKLITSENGTAFTEPILFRDQPVGTVFLQTELKKMPGNYWSVWLGAVVIAICLVTLAGYWLQRLISQPVLNLARVANEVAARQNYSIRAVKQSDDDLGHLVGSFNWMLTLIQAREAELQKARDELERRVAERTSALSQANELLRMENRERQRAEEALRNSQQKLLLHVRQTPLGVIDWNLDFQPINWNPSAEKIFGYTEIEALGRNACDLIFPAEARENAEKNWENLLEGKGGKNQVLQNRTKDNKQIVCQWFNTPLVTIDGRIVGVSSLVLDITQRQQAEEALRNSEELFSKAFQSSPLAISINSLETERFLDVNDSFLSLFGFERNEVIGKNPKVLGIWDNPAERINVLEQLQKKRQIRDFTSHFRTKTDLLRTSLLSAELIELGREACALFIYHDITERVSLEEQLRQSQKMEAVGRLAAGVAHDFNNILTIIQGHTALMLKKQTEEGSTLDSLKQVANAAERAANLVRQLLAFSRRQVMQPRSLDLNETVKNMARMLNRMLGEDISLAYDCSDALPAITADVGMIEQVILNLVINARDAMPTGGQVTVRTEVANIDNAYVQQHSEARVGQFVRLSIADTGCGIEESLLSRIFEPFFTTKEVGKGTGLGLSMVYGIVKQHGGWIEVESQVGSGTAFKIHLPYEPVQPSEALAPVERVEEAPGGTETVLVVEDEPALRELVRNVLEYQGYHVITASNGLEGLRAWDDNSGKIDLLITDMVMPEGVSGRVLAERLKSKQPDIKVLYTSGYSVDLFAKNFTLQEGVNFIAKPFHPVRLAKVVRDCLDATGAEDPVPLNVSLPGLGDAGPEKE